MGETWRCHIEHRIYADDFALYLRGREKALLGFEFAPLAEMEGLSHPGVRVDQEMLQSLMNELWAKNFRPAGYADVHESVKAKDVHLQDMRAIVFSKLNVAKP